MGWLAVVLVGRNRRKHGAARCLSKAAFSKSVHNEFGGCGGGGGGVIDRGVESGGRA